MKPCDACEGTGEVQRGHYDCGKADWIEDGLVECPECDGSGEVAGDDE